MVIIKGYIRGAKVGIEAYMGRTSGKWIWTERLKDMKLIGLSMRLNLFWKQWHRIKTTYGVRAVREVLEAFFFRSDLETEKINGTIGYADRSTNNKVNSRKHLIYVLHDSRMVRDEFRWEGDARDIPVMSETLVKSVWI